MPLWNIYHPSKAFSPEDKLKLAGEITKLYFFLPKFYVNVLFHGLEKESFLIGGEPRDNFVRVAIDHIAREFTDARMRDKFLQMIDDTLAPFVRDRGMDWEFDIDQTPVELWRVQGLVPPETNSSEELRWKKENRASSPVQS